MCRPEAGFTTVVGTPGDLGRLRDAWEQLQTPRRLGLSQPQQIELSHLELYSGHPQVAVITHEEGLAAQAADGLQAELLANPSLPTLLCEPGFFFRAAQQASLPGTGGPTVELDDDSVDAAVENRPYFPALTGSKVALLDSGDTSATHDQIIFEGTKPQPCASDDKLGHGSAVAAIIRAVRPSADIYPVTVLRAANAPSYDVLNGLIYCLWACQDFDIINASLSTEPLGDCPNALGLSLAYVMAVRAKQGGNLPILVAAAGNTPDTEEAQYPALLPGAIVAIALDWHGQLADYNAEIPEIGIETQEAFGGTKNKPFGYIKVDGKPDEPIFGTSFAAAIVTAAHLPNV